MKQEELYVSAQDLQELFKIDSARLTRLKGKGILTPIKRNEYPLLASTDAYIRHIKSLTPKNNGGGPKSSGSTIEELNKEKLKKEAISNAEKLGLLVDRKAIIPLIQQSAQIIYKILEQIPLEFKREFPDITPEQISGLDKLIKRTQNAALVDLPEELRSNDPD